MFRLEIILGPMFSGKSTELLRRISRYEAIGQKILLINHTNDSRTGDSVKTHDKITRTALKTDNLEELLQTTEYKEADVIGIDEAQFFTGLRDFVLATESKHKIIIMSGLDGDYKREAFGEILQCIPLCDSVVKLSAMCMISKDGTPGIFSKRIVNNSLQTLVGASETYVAASRKHYLD